MNPSICILPIFFPVSLAQGRSRREKKDKHGRFAALARLKDAKSRGEKHKYDVSSQSVILIGNFYGHIWELFPIQKWPLFSQFHVFQHVRHRTFASCLLKGQGAL